MPPYAKRNAATVPSAMTAQRDHRTLLVESRKGINIPEDGLTLLDETVSPLIRESQSVYMILQNHPKIAQCEKTIYNYIDSGAGRQHLKIFMQKSRKNIQNVCFDIKI